MFAVRKDSPLVPFCLLVLLIICWMEVDLYAPSFPQIRLYFNTTEEMIQWSLSINFIGYFFSSLLCGPLADSYGRKPIFVGGSLIFVLGSLLCVAAPNLETFLAGRLLQGLGVSAPTTIALAIIGDLYQGDTQVRMMSFMNSVITITMALAPIIGAYLSEAFGWRSNFMVIFAGSLIGTLIAIFILPETMDKDHRQRFSLPQVMKGYKKLITNKLFFSTTMGLALLVTPYFVFIAIIPFLFMDYLKLPLSQYVFYQGSVVALFALLSLAVPLLVGKFDGNKLNAWSSILSFVATVLLCLHGMFLPDQAFGLTALMCLYVVGIVWPSAFLFTATLEIYPELRGSASALFQALRMLMMAVAIFASGYFYEDKFLPVGVLILLLLVLALPLLLYSVYLQKKLDLKSSGPVSMH